MKPGRPCDSYFAETHHVENVPPILENYNLFATDPALADWYSRFGQNSSDELHAFGEMCGQASYLELGVQANENKPVFRSHDRYGHRIDEVRFHPAYHELMRQAMGHGLHALPWTETGEGQHVKRAALSYLHTQVEAGHGCPITMTFACYPTLAKQPEIAAEWFPKIHNHNYDPANTVFFEKSGLTIGMAMTEKQGGSDVRTNTTVAHAIGEKGSGQLYELVGHKFFVSAPMSDGFLMLAHSDQGLSCFLVPRWRPDGSKNPIQINQLKDKMGNVSNASCETELRGALGWMIGEEGRGIRNIIEMVALTRFDCMIGSSAGMRQAVVQAIHHCRHRAAFGKTLIDQPLMQNVLADLAIESEAALALSLRMARALDQSPSSEAERLLVRIGTAVGKYWICKRTPAHAYEAMECIGGSGVMETTAMPRLYREAPVNSIWEGSGNVQCLDVLRAVHKTPQTLEVLFEELETARGRNEFFDRGLERLESDWRAPDREIRARSLVEGLALCWQASLLLQGGTEEVAEAFCASRLGMGSGRVFGTLPAKLPMKSLIDRCVLV